jgi:beta-glucosidase
MGRTSFPDGFLWGAATSSHQVEGGNRNNDWWRWEQAGRIFDGSASGDAAGWWDGRAEEDLSRAAELGHTAHRMSLEWSRLEPEPGRFDERAFDRYAAILSHARDLGLGLMVTLNHFTLPGWLADRGSWLAPDAVPRFAAYTRACAQRLGPLVDLWATLNEPDVVALSAYAERRWPPGTRSLRAARRAVHSMLRAHAAAYAAVKAASPGSGVGLVVNQPLIEPASGRVTDRLAAQIQDRVFNAQIVRGLRTGRLPISRARADRLAGSVDFIGLNYYGRYLVRFDAREVRHLFGRHIQPGTVRTEHTDWGQPWAAGLTQQLVRLSRLGVPLYVTENGIGSTDDGLRTRYLADHLRAVRDALALGVDVRGYFHWSLVDNFEWAEGWSVPFGLLGLDRATQARTIRPSARLYERICRSNGAVLDSETVE